MTLEYWYLLPVAILVATVAMASGVGGATFFTPIFMLGLGLSPEVAIGVGTLVPLRNPFGVVDGPDGVLEDSYAVCPKPVLAEELVGELTTPRLICLGSHRQVSVGGIREFLAYAKGTGAQAAHYESKSPIVGEIGPVFLAAHPRSWRRRAAKHQSRSVG